MNLFDIVWAVLVCWVTISLGTRILAAISNNELEEKLEKVEKLRAMIHEVNVEKHGEMTYWFDAENNQFLGQGKTLEEIVSVIKSRFPDHIFVLKELGGLARYTNWKLVPHEDLKQIKINLADL